MYKLKNRPDKLIIVYHEDDKHGASYAAVLYQKGFDNIFLLTGGVEDFYQQKPELVVGSQLPPLNSDLGTLR
jgi:centrosomal protein CEP41